MTFATTSPDSGSRWPRLAMTALLLALCAGTSSSAADDDLVVLPHRDFVFVMRDFLERPDFSSRSKALEKLVLELPGCLRGRLYEPATEAVRRETRVRALRSVWHNADFYAFLSQFARTAPPHYSDLRLFAVEILADRADLKTLGEILEILELVGENSVAYPDLLPHLGRAIASASTEANDGDARLLAANEVLEHSLYGNHLRRKGAAISGMIECGRADAAQTMLQEALDGQPPHELLPLLSACRRSLLRADMDPATTARVLALVRAQVQDFLDRGPGGPIGGITGLSPKILRFREAYNLLRLLGEAEDAERFLRAFRRDGAASLLGLDGLQRTRLWFKYHREELGEDQRQAIDSTMAGLLLNTAERLFDIEEAPMDAEERATFLDARDVRYNCASYFTSLWDEEPGIRARWCDNPDAIDFLELLVKSDKDEFEGSGQDRRWTALQDKKETRVVTARLLAHLCVATDMEPAEFDLAHFFLRNATLEMGADPQLYWDAFLQWRGLAPGPLCLLIPERRPPPDDFVKVVSLLGLEILGYDVDFQQSGDVLIQKAEDESR